MLNSTSKFKLYLIGPFRLFDPNGERINLTSKRGQALVATLAVSESGEHTRPWLQNQLWGSRQPEQAQASLRRELSNLRRVLNRNGTSLVNSDRSGVRLNLNEVEVDVRKILFDESYRTTGSIASNDFLEGLDINGEESFEDWLRDQRSVFEDLTPRRSYEQSLDALPKPLIDMNEPAPGFGGKPALAVLPFKNLTKNHDFDFLAEGLSEDLIERMSRLRWLPVISQSSSFNFDESRHDLNDVSATLGARYILTGRLMKREESLSLKISLSDGKERNTIWSEQFVLETNISYSKLNEISESLVGVLDTRIDSAEQRRAIKGATQIDGMDIDQLVWRGRWYLNKHSTESLKSAEDCLLQALEINPDSIGAIVQLTFAKAWRIWSQRQSDEQIKEMRTLANRAIALDDFDPRGYLLAGMAEMWLRRFNQAKPLLSHSLYLNPSLARGYAQLGSAHYLSGEPEEALTPLKTAIRLSPNEVQVFYVLGEIAVSHLMMQQWSDAVEYANEAIALRPSYWYAHVTKINALARSGNADAVATAKTELAEANPKFEPNQIDWLPFADRTWNEFLKEGMTLAV